MAQLCLALRRQIERLALAALVVWALPLPATAQPEGGLYIAGYDVGFEQAAGEALARNPGGQRFFLLVLPPHMAALMSTAPKPVAAVRERVIAGNGVLLVCQRDIASGAVDAPKLAAGVVAVRGWPPAGRTELPVGERYFPGEDRATLPQANEALRRLRSTCS